MRISDWSSDVCSSDLWPNDQAGDRTDRMIVVNGKRVSTTDQMFWAGIGGVVALPSTAAPAGLTKSGLPVGIQIVAPHLHDRTAINMSRLNERTCGGFVPPTGHERKTGRHTETEETPVGQEWASNVGTRWWRDP